MSVTLSQARPKVVVTKAQRRIVVTAPGPQGATGAGGGGGGGGGSGDVVGPASAVDSNLAAFDATTGKLIKDAGTSVASINASIAAKEASGTAAASMSAHLAAGDPHPQYTTAAEASAAAPVQSVAGRTGVVTLAKADVGLGNVDNTSDLSKPISTATQAALDAKEAAGTAAAAIAAHVAAVDPHPTYTTAAEAAAAAPVQSVAGRTGAVTLTKTDVGLANVDNTSDLSKPVSTAQQTALDLKANLASPALTGTPTVPTAAADTNTTQAASTAFVQQEIANDTTKAAASHSHSNATTGAAGFMSAADKSKLDQFLPGASAALTIATGKSVTLSNSLTISGVDGSTLNVGSGGTLGTAAYAASSSFAAASHQHSGADITSGTVDPTRLGSGASIGTKFLRGDSTWQTIGGGGDALVGNPLSQFAATSSAQLAGVISDETGSGALVFATSPTLVTPALGTPSSGVLTNCTGLPVAGGGTGVATLTAYAPLFGGTTGTGAVQSGTVGTAGQVLTSNGAGALPTFQTPAGGGGSVATDTIFDAKGDIPCGTGSNTASILTAGFNDGFLTYDSSKSNGVKTVDRFNPFLVGRKRIRWWTVVNASQQGVGVNGVYDPVWGASSVYNNQDASNPAYLKSSSAATINDRMGATDNGTGECPRAGDNITFRCVFKLFSTSDIRVWCGISTSTSAHTSDTPPANSMLLRYSTSAGDSTFKFLTSNGSTAQTTDTGIAADTNWHRLEIVEVSGSQIRCYIDDVLVATNSTNMPVSGTAERSIILGRNLAASVKDIGVACIATIGDYK